MVIVVLLIGLLACIIPVGIISLIVSAVVKKNKESKSSFEDSIRSIYVYIILIITLIAIISGVIASFRIGLDVLLPEESLYQNSYDNDQQEKNENIIELFTTLSLVVSVTPVFTYHNKLAKKIKADKLEEQNAN